MEYLQVSDYSIFYEFADSGLLRRMQPIELAYCSSGTGDATVVCLHSLEGASQSFAGLADALDGQGKVVALDFRGFGRSHRPTQDYSVDLWVGDVLRLLGVIDTGAPPVVYGHGLGACVALALAGQVRLGGLALSGIALSPGQPGLLDELIETGDRGEPVLEILERLTGAPPFAEDLTPQIVARAARAWQSFDARPLVAELATPLIVFAGEDDELTPPDSTDGAAKLAELTGAPLARLTGGHDAPTAQPAVLAEALLDWLNDRKG